LWYDPVEGISSTRTHSLAGSTRLSFPRMKRDTRFTGPFGGLAVSQVVYLLNV
jgi:hypothetical protein